MITAVLVEDREHYGQAGDWKDITDFGLIDGVQYEVTDITVRKYSTLIELRLSEGVTRMHESTSSAIFNAVCFQVYEDGKPLDYCSDSRFVPQF